ncbi:MAG TPA: ribose 5-phosphate isomerase A [Rhodobiaceae bacterium]|nr:ribose 5-phosphate isomerase A [Rhodobiaceae bacterium]|tara:strand:- start:329 stop:1057 length:729 start_codon:yes stop_codon:yes gene_type:complete
MSWQDRILQPNTPVEQMKQKAALRALETIESGMTLGLGTGSTARYFVDGLGAKLTDGLSDIVCVPTSEATRQQAESLNIKLAPLDELQHLDITVDGADELDDALRLIKGGGGALLREKIVAAASDKMIVIADYTKKVPVLGTFDLPVEVNMFAHGATAGAIADALKATDHSGAVKLRGGDTPFITDGGHYIYDCALGAINDPQALAQSLLSVPGVVEHGLFLGYAKAAILAGTDGLEEVGNL